MACILCIYVTVTFYTINIYMSTYVYYILVCPGFELTLINLKPTQTRRNIVHKTAV